MDSIEEQYQERWEMFADRVDTPQPCERGDTVSVSQLSGVPEWMADYPVTGEVVRLEPRGIGTHNIFADWFVSVRFDEDEETGVYGTTSELFCVGGTRRDWDELPVEVVDTE
jgi:hypothetical protein